MQQRQRCVYNVGQGKLARHLALAIGLPSQACLIKTFTYFKSV